MAQQQERQHSQDDKPGFWLKSGLHQQQQGYFLSRMNKTCEYYGTSPSFSQSSSSTTPSPSTSAPPSFITASASILLPAFGSRFLLCSTFSSFFSIRSLLPSSSPPFPALTKTASSSSPSWNSAATEQQHRRHNQSHQDQNGTSSSSSSSPDSNLFSTPSAPITLKQATMEGDAGVIAVVTLIVPAPAPAPGQNAFADYWTAVASSSFYLAAVAATGVTEAARSKTAETTSLLLRHSNTSLFSFTYLLRLLFLVMTTRHTSATPAPAPAPAPQSSETSQPASAEQKAIPLLSPASEPTTSNPPPNAPVKTNDPPSPARLTSDTAAAPPSPTSSLPQSFPHTSNTAVPVTPPASTVGPPPLSTITTATSSIHASSTTNHHTSLTNHHTDSSQPSGTPYGTIGSSNESSNQIMLTVSLIVVFVILAGMGLVVYCLFRRRTAKRRMHPFGGIGGSKNTSGSLDSSAAAGNSGIGSGGRRKSMTAHRQSTITLGGGSVIGTGGKGDPMTTALAEMQEQQRRISDGDMSRALQAMTEKHQSALMTRRSSTLSLGGLHHHNHHQHHLPQNQQYPGSRVVSPNLGPARPHSALGAGYWSGGGGPAGGVDPAGEGSKRATMSGGNIVIGSGNYVAGPLESSPDFRTTLYDDLYYPSPQFLYASSGGGSSGANSSEQLVPPHHHNHHPHYYNSGPPSSANMSRRSSLSPGAYPTHPPSEMAAQGQNPTPIFRAKTISTSSGQSYQQQMQYQQLYPPHVGPGPHRYTPPPHSSTPPPHLNRMSVPQPPATVTSSSDDSSETVSNNPSSKQQQECPEGSSVGLISGDTIPRTSSPLADPTLEHQENHHHPRRPHSMSTLQNNNSFTSPHGVTAGPDRSQSPPLMSSSTGNLLDQHLQHRASYDGSSQLIIPPSITTRRRSAMPSALGPSGGVTSPGGSYPYQQGYPQQQHPYGGSGQDYFQDGQQYPISPRSSSPYGYGNAPYQDHRPNHYQYAQRSSTQLSREPDHQGKSEYIQDGGAGVGVGSSVKTASSSSSSSPGGTSNTTSTVSTPIPTSVNLNSVRSKSPPPPQVWPSRSNGNGAGSGPIVHIAPAPPSSSSSSSRASATAAAAGLTILPPVDRESSLAADLQLTEVLDSPTDSSAH